MGMRVKLRQRDPPPNPWRWEIFDDTHNKLITSSARAYASRPEAYADGQAVLAGMVAREAGM
jgi:hypothetical protein